MRLLYDARIFLIGNQQNTAKTGIYFTAYNILYQMFKNKNLEISLYSPSQKELTYHICSKIYPQQNFEILNDEDKYSHIEAFFSPIFSTPSILKNKPYIFKYFVLYDIIPLIKPEYFANGASWFFELINDINKNDYYFAISDYTKNDFIKYIPVLDLQHIKTIPLAANKNFFPCFNKDKINLVKKKYDIPLNKKYILSLCTLEPRKNLIRALNAFIIFISTNNITDIVYVLGGTHWPDFLDEIKKQIPEYQKFSNYILPIGYVDDEDIPPLYSGAEFFVYTSIYEGFGLPLLEAMQCGVPVIASNVTSIPEVVGDAAVTVDPLSIEEHISAFAQFYYNPELKKIYKERGLAQTKKFTWEKCEAIISDTIFDRANFSFPHITIISLLWSSEFSQELDSLRKCIESVHSQIYSGPIEHIIITNIANSAVTNILQKYQTMGWIQVYYSKSTSKYAALNEGIDISHGQYIAFLDVNCFYHGATGLAQSIKAIYYTKSICCTTSILMKNKSKDILWKGGYSKLTHGLYPNLNGMLTLRSILLKNKFDVSISRNILAIFLLKLASYNSYIYCDHCFVSYKTSNDRLTQAQCIPDNHGLLFYQYIGKKNNLNLYDCFFLTQKELFFSLRTKIYIDAIISKLPDQDWKTDLLKKCAISNVYDPMQLLPIRNKDILRYMKYKIFSYIYLGKRHYYKKKYRTLFDKLKRINSSS